jgi:hypothetical protein
MAGMKEEIKMKRRIVIIQSENCTERIIEELKGLCPDSSEIELKKDGRVEITLPNTEKCWLNDKKWI